MRLELRMVDKAKVSGVTSYVGNVDAPTVRPNIVLGSARKPVFQLLYRPSPGQG